MLFLYRFVCFRHASGRRFSFAEYDAGYRTFATVAVAAIPVRQLRAIHLDRGSMLLSATPHYAFVRNRVDGDMSREPYLTYMTLRLDGSEERVRQRVESFERLIDHYMENRPDFLLLIHLISCDTAHILDGFHRAAIIHALDPNARVCCAIVRPT
jgi:hypothetical protein